MADFTGIRNNTAESFNSLLERAKQGVFHYMSQKHLSRYLNEIGFRWAQRTSKTIVTKGRRRKTDMVALPVMDMLHTLLTHAVGRQLRRTAISGVRGPIANFAGV
jgi:thermostable 8-oxoguanine DNA glycosylase